MKYQVTHITQYKYADSVPECFNIVRLAPRAAPGQICREHELIIAPQPTVSVQQRDYFENRIEFFSLHEPFESLSVTAKNKIDVSPQTFPDAASTPAWESIVSLPATTNLAAHHFQYDSPHIRSSKKFADYAAISFTEKRPVMEAAVDLTERIFNDFEFNPRATTVSTPVEEVFEKRAGVCQDFAHFQIACLRSLGLPARYVSGYLRTVPPPGKPRLVGADASHAWVSVYCGEAGWIDLDPTNNVVPDTDHIVVAWGRDYFDVSPMQGVFTGGGEALLEVSVDVMPLDEQE